jgi:multidrug efflux pump subunit AcrA (membrane-fusion protein)
MNRMNHRITVLLFWMLSALLGACGGQKNEQAASPSAAVTAPVATAKVETVKEFVDGAGRKMLLVPTSSVISRVGSDQVFVVGPDSIVALRWVSTGHALGASTIVLGGLEKGETVVVSPAAELREGTKVSTDKHTQDRAKEAQH